MGLRPAIAAISGLTGQIFIYISPQLIRKILPGCPFRRLKRLNKLLIPGSGGSKQMAEKHLSNIRPSGLNPPLYSFGRICGIRIEA